MTRPSRQQDQLLIEAAKRLLPDIGISGMSLKMIADEAGVNIGMFHYYFKTKSNFVLKVLESIDDNLMRDFEEQHVDKTSIEQLRCFLISIGQMFRNQKKILVSMYRDVLNQEPEMSQFMLNMIQKRIQFLTPLLEKCRQDNYVNPSISNQQIIGFCLAAINAPMLFAETLERLSIQQENCLMQLMREFHSDEAIFQRADMAIMAIS